MIHFNRFIGTWERTINVFLFNSQFAVHKMSQVVLDERLIQIKPNLVFFESSEPKKNIGQYALYVGRLSEEKGIMTLMQSWHNLDIPIKIAGSGELLRNVKKIVADRPNIEILGQLSKEQLGTIYSKACFLIMPTVVYETFGRVIIEAFSFGIPVISSRIGAIEELVDDGRTGLFFTPGDAKDLAVKAQWAWDHPKEMAEMGRNARREYEEKYTAERNYQMLMDIYQQAIENHKKR